MSEDINIGIKTTYDDAAAKKALADKEKLASATPGVPPTGAPSGSPAAAPDRFASNVTKAQVSASVRAFNADVAATMARYAAEEKAVEDEKKAAAQKKVDDAKAKEDAKEAAAVKKEAAAKEKETAKEVTKEHKEQEILAKAREGYATRIARATGLGAERLAGATGAGRLTSAIGGGGLLTTIGAIGATMAVIFGKEILQHMENVAVRSAVDEGERGKIRRQLWRQSRESGSAESNQKMAEGFADEAVAAQEDRKALQKSYDWRWIHPTKWLENITGESKEPLNANADRERRALDSAPQAAEQARKRYALEVAPLIEAQNKINQGDARGARLIQDKVAWQQEYNRVFAMTKSDSDAMAAADTAFSTTQRERAGKFASLVTARDGAGDIARIAGLAREQRLGSRTVDILEDIHATMGKHQNDNITAATRRNFARGDDSGVPSLLSYL